jgi:hypothetical protein
MQYPTVGSVSEDPAPQFGHPTGPRTSQPVDAGAAPWPLGPPVTEVPVTTRRGTSKRLPLIVGAVVGVAALVIGAIVLSSRGSSSSGGSTSSSVASVKQGVAIFETLEINPSVSADRVWTANGVELAGETVLTNTGDKPVVVVYDEVIPDDVVRDPADVQFDPPVAPEMLINKTAGRHIVPLEAGKTATVTFEVRVDGRIADETLAAWTDAWADEYKGHLDDAKFSPVDGDVDGVTDIGDECPDAAGVIGLAGCPDADADGVRDDGADACVGLAGTAETAGCPDADGDKVRDDGADACVDVAGTVDTAGCPDADGDKIRDDDGSDACPTVAGPVGTKGCPDTDGDTVSDGDDICPAAAGEPAAKGCPDSDGDSVDDGVDKCLSEAGSPAAEGCPDRDGDAVADGSDFCPDNPGTIAGCPDSDGDGVPDRDDACENVAATDKSGCPDSDGDGVHDGIDKCPSQKGPSGGNGCPASTSTTRPPAPGDPGTTPPPPASNRSISLSGPSSATVGVLSDRFSVSTNGFSASSISWSDGSSGSSARFSFDSPGSFTVSVTVTDENGKSYSKSITVNVS